MNVENRVIADRAWEAFEADLQEQGYELVEVEYAPGHGGIRILRVYMDKPGGAITLDDCTAASQLLSALLDAGGFIDARYVLEVSSPGIERPLRKPSDFARFVGAELRVTTYAPVDNRRNYRGVLKGFEDGLIALECDGTVHEIHIENLKKAQLVR